MTVDEVLQEASERGPRFMAAVTFLTGCAAISNNMENEKDFSVLGRLMDITVLLSGEADEFWDDAAGVALRMARAREAELETEEQCSKSH